MPFIKNLFIVALLFLLTFSAHAQDDLKNPEAVSIVDPILHVVVSGQLAFSANMFFSKINENMPLGRRYMISGLLALTPGILKEIYDEEFVGDGADINDIGLNILGVGGGILLHYFVFDRPERKKHAINLNVTQQGLMAGYRITF